MKQSVHPTYFSVAKVTCSCGNTFVAGSTKEEIHVEICSNCHPLWTGEQKYIDTHGQIDRFKQRMQQAQTYKKSVASKKDKAEKKRTDRPKSLRELLLG